MSINVNNNNVSKPLVDNQKLQQQQGQSASQTQAQQASVAQTAARSDSVSLTQSAQQLSQLHKKGSETSTVNQEKVDRLKKAIQAGDYKVNPEKLAQNIAKFESELFGIK